MENNVSIAVMVNEILTLLRDSKVNFTQATIHEYELSLGIIKSYLDSQGILVYEKDIVASRCRKLCLDGRLSKTRTKHILVALRNLNYYAEHRELQPKNGSRFKLECQSMEHVQILASYLEYCHQILSIKEETLRIKRVYDIHFLNYLSLKQISLQKISGDTVKDYLSSIDKEKNWTARTKNANLYELRQLLLYLIDKHGVNNDSISPVSIVIGCHESHLPAYYEPSEISRMVNHIDTSSAKGKRDYLICLLFTQLGMRAGDVSGLSFSDIHWDRSTIEIVQQKTGSPLILPLLPIVRFAILDYWRNARAESKSETILITQSEPYRPLAPAFLSNTVSLRLRKAGIVVDDRKHGCHAMRHSLARNLLSNNEPLSAITGILGHKNSNTTRKYLGIDTKELRRIALEVPYAR